MQLTRTASQQQVSPQHSGTAVVAVVQAQLLAGNHDRQATS